MMVSGSHRRKALRSAAAGVACAISFVLSEQARGAVTAQLLSSGPNDAASLENYRDATFAAASKDLETVVFFSQGRLTADDENFNEDLFISHRGRTSLVTPIFGDRAYRPPEFVSLSSDGDVFFSSTEAYLQSDDDGSRDLYRWSDGSIQNVTDSAGVETRDHLTVEAITPDGGTVVIDTDEALSTGDSDQTDDAYVIEDGEARLLIPQTLGAPPVRIDAISDDGEFILALTRGALTDADQDETLDFYRMGPDGPDLVSGSELSTGNFEGLTPYPVGFLSKNGGTAVFTSGERLDDEDFDGERDIYRWTGGSPQIVSTSPLDTEGEGPPTSGGERAYFAGASDNGEFVFFDSDEPLVEEDPNLDNDYYRFGPDGLQIVTSGPADEETVYAPRIGLDWAPSSNGRMASFSTDRTLIASDRDEESDVYAWRDGSLELASIGPQGEEDVYGLGTSIPPSLDSTLFQTTASLVPADHNFPIQDAFLRSGSATLPIGPFADTKAEFLAASGDLSRFVVSSSSRLVSCDRNGRDLFLLSVSSESGTVIEVSKTSQTRKRASFRVCASTGQNPDLKCAVDDEPFRPCEEKFRTSRLGRGLHVLRVRALTADGRRVGSQRFQFRLGRG